MWARVVEVTLGCWLLISPFVFDHGAEVRFWWYNDILLGFAIVILALASFYRPWGNAHLLLIPIGFWMTGLGYFWGPHPSPPASQNHILLGFVLLLFAIIPNDANESPGGWRRFEAAEGDRNEAE